MTLAPLLTLAALALLPASAAAADGTYDVELDVALAYAHDRAWEWGDTNVERQEARAAGRIQGVVLRDGRLVDPGRATPATVSGASGSVVPGDEGRPTGDGCTTNGAVAVGAPRLYPGDGAQAELLLAPMDELVMRMRCVYGGTGEREERRLATIFKGGARWVGGPAVGRVAVPGEGPRTDRTIDATVSGAECPFAGEGTTACTLTMRGTVTFVRTGDAPAPARPMRLPKLRGAGPRNGHDNLFIYSVTRTRGEGVLTARRSGTKDGQPTGAELQARTTWSTRGPRGHTTTANYAFAGTGPVWGVLAGRSAMHAWTGTARFDEGWREWAGAYGDEAQPLEHDHGTCDVRWRGRTAASGEFRKAGRGLELRLTMPNLPRGAGCRTGITERTFSHLGSMRPFAVQVPLDLLRFQTITIPFEHSWKRPLKGGTATLTYRGFVELRRVSSCRTPPEYPCHTRFAASG